MLDLIKYSPVEWRKQNNYCVPKGPGLASAKEMDIYIGGSRLSFKAPRHKPRRSESRQTMPFSRTEDALSQGLRKTYSNGVMANDMWGFSIPFVRRWTFWGPWMSGAKAELSMSVSVVGRYDEFAYSDISFFHPRAFENVIVDYLNDSYGHQYYDNNLPEYLGPEQWQVRRFLPVSVAHFKIYTNYKNFPKRDPAELLLFPITQKHFVQVAFRQSIYSHNQDGQPAFDTSPIDDLQNAIINSLQLTLSPGAQAEWDRVKAECPDMALAEHFPPLQWPVAQASGEQHERALLEQGDEHHA